MIELSNQPSTFLFAGDDIFITATDTDASRVGIQLIVTALSGHPAAGQVGSEVYRFAGSRSITINARSFVHAALTAFRDDISIDAATAWAETLTASHQFILLFSPVTATSVGLSEASFAFTALRASTTAESAYMRGYVFDSGQWLSYVPALAPITPGAALHLSFFNKVQRPIKLVARYHFAGGTTANRVLVQVDDAKIRVQHFAVSWALLATDVAPFERVDLWVRDGVNANISSLRSFVLAPAKATDRYLLFQNSIGGWDNILCGGTATEGNRYTRRTARHQNLVRVVDTERVATFQIELHPLAARWADPLAAANIIAAELLASRQIYLVTPTKITEVSATTAELNFYTDGQFANSLSIELEAVRVAKAFTQPALVLPPTWDGEGEGYFETGYINPNYFA